MPIEVNSDTFENEVVSADVPVLVDFWGPSCGPCLALMPQVEEMESKYSEKLKIVKIDASKNRRLCLNLRVLGLPTFLVYKEGQEVERLNGENLTIQEIEKAAAAVV